MKSVKSVIYPAPMLKSGYIVSGKNWRQKLKQYIMKITDNNSENQLLENLFREVRLETPTSNFTEKLSSRIEKEIRKKERKQQWKTAGQIAAGILCIISFSIGILYWQSEFTFSFLKPDLSFDPLIWVIGLAVLLVLLGDSLLRRCSH